MKPYIIIGVIAASIGITLKVLFFVSAKFDVSRLMFSNLAELAIVALVPIVAVIYQIKFDSKSSFDQRFRPLIGSSLVCSMLFAGFAFCYFAYINPSFAQHFVMENEALLKQNAKTPEDFKKVVDFYINHWRPLNQATSAIFGMFFVGLFISLIAAGVAGIFGPSKK